MLEASWKKVLSSFVCLFDCVFAGANPRQNMTVFQLCARGVCVQGPPENLSDLIL